MLETLSETFKDKDLNDMNLEKQGVGEYNRVTVRGQANSFRVDCMKNVYEALIEYVLTHGADKDVSKAQRVLGLYTRWKELNDLVKKGGAGNAGGGGKKKKAAAADDTIQKAKAKGKKHALKKYDQFALNTSYFWGSTGSNTTLVVRFHEIFVTKIMNKLIYCC